MSTVTWNLFNGAEAVRHIQSGYAITRVALVTGLTSAQGRPDVNILNDAVAAVSTFIGQRGSPCSYVTVPTYLEQFIPELVNQTTVRVRVVYKGLPAISVDVDSALSQVDTNLDYTGTSVYTEYAYPAGYLLDPAKAGKTHRQGGLMHRPTWEPAFTVKFPITATLRVFGPITIPVVSNITTGPGLNYTNDIHHYVACLAALVGKVNDATYEFMRINGAARTWMVTKFLATSSDGDLTFNAALTLQYREATWDPYAVFINPDTGQPPSDLVKGTGIVQVKIPQAVAFPQLRVVVGDTPAAQGIN